MSLRGHRRELAANELLSRCTATEVGGITGADAISRASFMGFGQARFTRALLLGVQSHDDFQNIAVFGIDGSGGFELLQEQLMVSLQNSRKRACGGESSVELLDWAYVHNFKTPRAPCPVSFKRGASRKFKEKMRLFVEELPKEIVLALASNEAEKMRREKGGESLGKWFFREARLLVKKVRKEYNFYLQLPPPGMEEEPREPNWFPIRKDVSPDEVITRDGILRDEDVGALSLEEQNEIQKKDDEIGDLVNNLLMRFHDFSQTQEAARSAVSKDFVQKAVSNVLDRVNLLEGADKTPALAEYISGLQKYIAENYEALIGQQRQEMGLGGLLGNPQAQRNPFLPFEVNVIVDNGCTDDSPIVAEHVGSIQDLSGFIEHTHLMGMMVTDHTKIFAGAVHRANGGFLVLNLQDLIEKPHLWFLLKRFVKTRKHSFETLMSLAGYEQSSLQPMPIPLTMRVVLFGSCELLELLSFYDPDFSDLFRIRAEVVPYLERNKEHVSLLAKWAHGFTNAEQILSLEPEGVAAVVEHAGRLAGDQRHLSTDIPRIELVIKEASILAEEECVKTIGRHHVEKALHEQFWRSNFFYECMQKLVKDGTLLVTVSKKKRIGQGNGLHVTERGDIYFGGLSRIGARVNLGKPGINHIEYDAKLGGDILGKGGMIVEGAHKGKFMQNFPFPVEARICFEQSYGMVDGDSASILQYMVLASEVAQIPIKQSLAVTGSLDLHGNIQPIGGVNEKIEGFFDVCRAVGRLSGEQGVVIPWQNRKNLMLRPDVVLAVTEGKFHVWAVRTLDEVAELFSDMPARVFNAKVQKSYEEYARKLKDFLDSPNDDSSEKESKKKGSKIKR